MAKITIPLDDAPDHAAAIGRMIGHWAIVESGMAKMLSDILCTPLRYGRHVLWSSFISIPAKLGVIERLIHAEPFHFNEGEQTKILAIVARVRTANSERTKLVHALYAAGDDSTKLTLMPGTIPGNTKNLFKESEQVTAQSIQAFVEELAELSADIQRLGFEIWPAGPRPPVYNA